MVDPTGVFRSGGGESLRLAPVLHLKVNCNQSAAWKTVHITGWTPQPLHNVINYANYNIFNSPSEHLHNESPTNVQNSTPSRPTTRLSTTKWSEIVR